jgi:hypothetical protein
MVYTFLKSQKNRTLCENERKTTRTAKVSGERGRDVSNAESETRFQGFSYDV